MSRHLRAPKGSSAKRVSFSSSKENDDLFLVQNENQVLKLKNSDTQAKIADMKAQQIRLTNLLAREEQDCQHIRNLIRQSEFTDDIRLETEKRALEERIALLKGNREIILRKISDVRRNSVSQSSRIPTIREDKKIIERECWEIRTSNQGTKVILSEMQQELEKCRKDNEALVSKRRDYGPIEKSLSNEIEQRIRLIKNQKDICKQLRKREAAMLFPMLVNKIELQKYREAVILVESSGLKKKLLRKKIFMLSLIRAQYVLFIKNRAMQALRSKFRPLEEQRIFERMISHTRERRTKNRMLRIWRSEAVKKQYLTTRYFQVQNVLERIGESMEQSNLGATFNRIKYWQNNPLHLRALQIIDSVGTSSRQRCLNMFFSSLVSAQNNYLNDQEVEEGAKQQSIILVMGIYFGAWARRTKDNKVSNRILKFKYFRELKKLRAISRKRELSQMLALTHEKIKQIDAISLSFAHIRKETVYGLLDSLKQEGEQVDEKNANLTTKIKHLIQQSKRINQSLSLFRICRHLKAKMQGAFDVWRKCNRKVSKLEKVAKMLGSKVMNDKNQGFSRIQKRRFQKLKESIADKIQSCEFSYNYLVEENQHIKTVLENKLLELEKSKFVHILHRLIRNEREIKHKYFFRFLRNGYQFWKFKKTYQKVDALILKKCKILSLFMLKCTAKLRAREEFIDAMSSKKIQIINTALLSFSFGVLQNIRHRNRKIKTILANVFSRNGELDVYVAYNLIRRADETMKQSVLNGQQAKIQTQIEQVQKETVQKQQSIETLRSRLAKKQASLYKRKILGIRKYYIRNYSNKLLHYLGVWRQKVRYEKHVKAFAQVLERKTRTLIKQKFVMNLFRKSKEEEIAELKARLKSFKDELANEINAYEKYSIDSEDRMKRMAEENESHQAQATVLERKTDRMDTIKVLGFRKYCNKLMCHYVLREWRAHKNQFINTYKSTFETLRIICLRYNFEALSQQMKQEILKNRIKRNLSKAYSKKYRQNAGLAMRVWRITNQKARIREFEAEYGDETRVYKEVIQKHQQQMDRYDSQVNFRIHDRKRRKIFDWLKRYTAKKLQNNARQARLNQWLGAGYQSEFFRLFCKVSSHKVEKKKKFDQFIRDQWHRKLRLIFEDLKTRVSRKRVISELFIRKFTRYSLLKLYEQLFARVKNYQRHREFCKKDHRTMCIQKVIETFEKKRKNILCINLRRWKRNQFEMDIARKLFRRLVRKAFYNRYEGMFYAWKREAEARKVLHYHHSQGEVKKRKVEILRLSKFLDDFKKKKGLLLENEEGNFVMSPRFQKKKEEEDKKEKNLRYKFVSRLIMSMNGYGAPIRAYQNLQTYMKLRQKYKKMALFVLNHLRKPNLLLAFRTWRKAAREFRESFQTMQRKDLMKILNRQKDKMEIEYSQKVGIDQRISEELDRYKLNSHQREIKEKLCVHALIKHADKVKSHAFRTWRHNVSSLREREMDNLKHKGEFKIQVLEEQINEILELEQQLLQTNRLLKETVGEAASIAEMVKTITEEREKLSQLIADKKITCQSLVEENQVLNSRLYLAQKEAMNLLIISGQKP